MNSASAADASPPIRLRLRDGLIAGVVAAVYAGLWWFVPAEWAPFHDGGKWFLGVFVVTSGLAALLVSAFVFSHEPRLRENPGFWLAFQVIFWNPLAFRAVVAGCEAIGAPDGFSSIAALAGLLLLGVPTSLVGVATCGSPSWIAAYLCRAMQCFVTTWAPLVPPLAFLHVLALVQAVTWDRYGRFNTYAVALVTAEQTLAFFWFFLFCRFE